MDGVGRGEEERKIGRGATGQATEAEPANQRHRGHAARLARCMSGLPLPIRAPEEHRTINLEQPLVV